MPYYCLNNLDTIRISNGSPVVLVIIEQKSSRLRKIQTYHFMYYEEKAFLCQITLNHNSVHMYSCHSFCTFTGFDAFKIIFFKINVLANCIFWKGEQLFPHNCTHSLLKKILFINSNLFFIALQFLR